MEQDNIPLGSFIAQGRFLLCLLTRFCMTGVVRASAAMVVGLVEAIGDECDKRTQMVAAKKEGDCRES
jgi:hypothetical protein